MNEIIKKILREISFETKEKLGYTYTEPKDLYFIDPMIAYYLETSVGSFMINDNNLIYYRYYIKYTGDIILVIYIITEANDGRGHEVISGPEYVNLCDLNKELMRYLGNI